MTQKTAPMCRKAFRFRDEDIAQLGFLADAAGLTESEKLRELIRSGASGTPLQQQLKKKKRKARSPRIAASLDPDTRLVLVRACNLLNQCVKALHIARMQDRQVELIGVSLQLSIIEELLIQVGNRQLAMGPFVEGSS